MILDILLGLQEELEQELDYEKLINHYNSNFYSEESEGSN